ncbi:MAG: hypothetical protein RI572_03770 [Salegentibacter sp.]|uniref:hypothetical protein n=1 Tax=Salegentibacter sp. TaxID=1903072 RepID=UPI0028708D08|nr:hypothetical protein [Salegentibacter sp.]MDR9456508.1 hypothetical protein [Salegentibacter sp.]
MKKTVLLLSILFVISCKNEKRSEISLEENKEETIAQEIARAHGFENFKDVEEIKFTFNVKVGDSVRTSRSWHWKTSNDEIRLTEGDISRTYVKDDSIADDEKELDQKFINDSYWLLFPFQLVWSDAEISEEKKAEAPISKKEMRNITVSYPSEGGYTPGDSYEIFYEDDLILKEWIYKSADGSRKSPTTWEDYKDFNGLKIARSHKSPDGSFELFFSGIEVN